MKRKLLAWVTLLCMLMSMLPTAGTIAAASSMTDLTDWPTRILNPGEYTMTVSTNMTPRNEVVIGAGVKLEVKGTGRITDGTLNSSIFVVENGGWLTLDDVSISGNTVGDTGAVYVKEGGRLDLGNNTRTDRKPPGITNNTTAGGAAWNLVVSEKGAVIRLNGAPTQTIGLSCAGMLAEPVSLIQGGRYEIKEADISHFSLDNAATEELTLTYDHLVLQAKKIKVLYWNPVNAFNTTDNTNRNDMGYLGREQTGIFESAGADTVTILVGSYSDPRRLVTEDHIMQYDLIYICMPDFTQQGKGDTTAGLTKTEQTLLLNYLNEGGRVFIQAEDSEPHGVTVHQNPGAQNVAKQLGAQFTINNKKGFRINRTNDITRDLMAICDTPLTKGITKAWHLAAASPIETAGATGVTVLFTGVAYDWTGVASAAGGPTWSVDEKSRKPDTPWCVDQAAGNKNGAKWGRLTVSTDANMFVGTDKNYDNATVQATQFVKNMYADSRKNRAAAAAGVNPNATGDQAKNVEKNKTYVSPEAGLEKVENNQTVELQRGENLTAAENVLLLNTATLKDFSGHRYKAAEEETYLNVSDTGAVTLKQGSLTATSGAPLFVGGSRITGSSAGYDVVYPSDRQDRAAVTLTTGNDTLTADGHVYTAERGGEKIYLGAFDVKVTGENVTTESVLPAVPYYNDSYCVTINPAADFSLGADDITTVTMGGRTLTSGRDYTVTADGTGVTVTIAKITDDVVIQTSAKQLMSDITVTGLISGGDTVGQYIAVGADGKTTYVPENGKITVPRNQALTLTFIPADESNMNTEVNENESFSILTALTEQGVDLFAGAAFDWLSKGYSCTFTPAEAEQELEAVFSKSHVVHVHVSEGKAAFPNRETTITQNTNYRAIVRDGNTLTVNFTNTGTGDRAFAKWNNDSILDFNGMDYTTEAITTPGALNVSFVDGVSVTVNVIGGMLDETGCNWKDAASGNGRETIVAERGDLDVSFASGNLLKSIKWNNTEKEIADALAAGELTENHDGSYTWHFSNIRFANALEVTFAPKYTVTFADTEGGSLGSEQIWENEVIPAETFRAMQAQLPAVAGKTFFAWADAAHGGYYTGGRVVTGDVTLVPIYRDNAAEGPVEAGSVQKAVIGADNFTMSVDEVKTLSEDLAKDKAAVTAVDKDGQTVDKAAVEVSDLETIRSTAAEGKYNLTFAAGGASVTVTVTVIVTGENPVVIGRTAHTITFMGRADVVYTVCEKAGTDVSEVTTNAGGKGVAVGLKKATKYTISSVYYGSAAARTSLVDAVEIAEAFEEKAGETTGNGRTDLTERAENTNVVVDVGEDGNYRVTLKQNIVDKTIHVPDTWGDVTVELNGHNITGPDGTDSIPAGSGLVFEKDEIIQGEGTNLNVTGPGNITGGNGSAANPDGAPGVATDKVGIHGQSGITVGNGAHIIGGNGAAGSEIHPGGGNGGAGVSGSLDVTVNGGSVTGGNGGNGLGTGTGGNGGNGIETNNKDVIVQNGGTVTGGNGGNGSGEGGHGGSGIKPGSGNADVGSGTIVTDGDAGKGNSGSGGSSGGGGVVPKPAQKPDGKPSLTDPVQTGVAGWLNTRTHNSYLGGYTDGTFVPDNRMTRAEAAQMFYNLLLHQDVEITASFDDVAADAWYAKAVNALASMDVIRGVGDNRFEPERPITRAEFAVISMRFAKMPQGGENPFNDVKQGEWYYDNVVGAVQYGWIGGYPDGTFRPDSTITRAEVTVIANRMLDRNADARYVESHRAELRQFSDVTESDWAYYPIVEATNSHGFFKSDGVEKWQGIASVNETGQK